jgi:hypothetical protein
MNRCHLFNLKCLVGANFSSRPRQLRKNYRFEETRRRRHYSHHAHPRQCPPHCRTMLLAPPSPRPIPYASTGFNIKSVVHDGFKLNVWDIGNWSPAPPKKCVWCQTKLIYPLFFVTDIGTMALTSISVAALIRAQAASAPSALTGATTSTRYSSCSARLLIILCLRHVYRRTA